MAKRVKLSEAQNRIVKEMEKGWQIRWFDTQRPCRGGWTPTVRCSLVWLPYRTGMNSKAINTATVQALINKKLIVRVPHRSKIDTTIFELGEAPPKERLEDE